MNMNLVKLWEMVRVREAWHATVHGLQRVGDDWVTEQQQINFEDREKPWDGTEDHRLAKNASLGSLG